MFSIMQGSEVLESTPRIEYVKLQTNGKKVTSTEADFHYYYSPKTDKLYDKETTSITEATTLEQALSVKLAELSEVCGAAINAGATVTLPDGTEEQFTYSTADQANISEMFTACLMGAESYPYHASDEACKTYTAAQIMAIYGTLSMYKTGQLTYHNQLKQYVKTLDDMEDVLSVVYGQPLTGDYLTAYNTLMQEAQAQMQAVISKVGGENAGS